MPGSLDQAIDGSVLQFERRCAKRSTAHRDLVEGVSVVHAAFGDRLKPIPDWVAGCGGVANG